MAGSPPTARKFATGQTQTATGAAGSQETALREFALPGLTARPDQNLQRGEIFGFPGPNGAGKTTTLRMRRTLLPTGVARSSQVMATARGRKKRYGNSEPRPVRPKKILKQRTARDHRS